MKALVVEAQRARDGELRAREARELDDTVFAPHRLEEDGRVEMISRRESVEDLLKAETSQFL